MALNLAYDIYPGIRLFSAASNNGTILLGGNTNIYSYDLLTGNLLKTSNSLSQEADSISFVNSASAVIFNGTNGVEQLLEITTGYLQTYTGGAALPITQKGQLSDGNGNNIVFACSQNTNQIVKFNGSTFSVSLVTPSSGFTGANALTIINKTGTQNFLIGTSNGKVHELDASGTNFQTITLPTTPNTGTAPTLQVSGLAYYNDNLFVMTNFGIGYHYKWSTSTLLNKYMFGASNEGSNVGNCLCNGGSGVTLLSQNINRAASTANNTMPTSQINFNASPTIVQDTFFNDFTNFTIATGIDGLTYTAWVIVGSASKELARIYKITGIGQTTEDTRIQNNGIDTSGRIIRLIDLGPGKSRVEIDTNIVAGVSTLNAMGESNYIEIATIGTPNSNEQADLRDFST